MRIYLELYYDLKQGRHAVGYIAKGWEEPGFRVGEIVEVPKWKIADMKEHVYVLLQFCATSVFTKNQPPEHL